VIWWRQHLCTGLVCFSSYSMCLPS
jgi:hypothetical protein